MVLFDLIVDTNIIDLTQESDSEPGDIEQGSDVDVALISSSNNVLTDDDSR